jgi:hypothetical protein
MARRVLAGAQDGDAARRARAWLPGREEGGTCGSR